MSQANITYIQDKKTDLLCSLPEIKEGKDKIIKVDIDRFDIQFSKSSRKMICSKIIRI